MLGGYKESIRDPEFLGASEVLLEIHLGFLQNYHTFDPFDQEEFALSVGSRSAIGFCEFETENI